MAHFGLYVSLFFVILGLNLSSGQLPPRFQVPGAVPINQPRPQQGVIRQRLEQLDAPGPRLRGRPLASNALPVPVREVRPVIEDPEEEVQQIRSTFDNEVARLGLQSAIQDADEDPISFRPRPRSQVLFKPERPVPVLRQDIRDNRPIPVQQRPVPVRQEVPRPVIRQELKQEQLYAPRPAPPVRQEIRDEPNIPVQHVRRPAPAPQPIRQPVRQQQVRAPARPAPQYLDDEDHGRTRKPPVQILRKYRTDNADGSITWGYENEDGSFKEENIGIDCITRGKYGYVDPDGVKREYTYETGGTCEEPDPELEDLPPQHAKGGLPPPISAGKKSYKVPVQYIQN